MRELTGGIGSVVNSIDISPDGKLIGSGGEDRIVRVYDLSKVIQLKVKSVDWEEFKGNKKNILCVKFTKESDKIISGGEDRIIRIFDIKLKTMERLMEHKSRI